MSESTNNSIFTLQDIHGKGKGLVATSKILKGTRILCEEPVIRVPEDAPDSPVLRASIRRQVDQLTSDQRQAFLSMCNVYPGETASQYLGIIRTNALPIDTGGGIFLDACSINHACDNNAQKAWNDNIGRHTIHALRDIEKGEEITITYIGVLNNRRTRQEVLRKKFMFTCVCRLCSLPEHLSAESDRRLDGILRLDSCIGREGLMGILSDPKRILGYVDRQVRLYNEQGPDDVGLPRAFFDAAQICAAHGDLARARVFTERAAAGWLVGEGDDSLRVLNTRQLARNPSSHDTYGHSAAWRTAADDIPQGLGSNEFEDWLWKREKDCKPEEQGLFRNQATFPSFIQLPNETDVDDNFFKTRDGVNYQPRRHWCFLAEITDYLTIVRLQMEVKDVADKKTQVFFYTGGRGSEIAPSQLCKGYTIAILYAQQHAFAFSEPGIRHEDPTLVKVCLSFPMDDLAEVSF
ncbi:SET domain protein [Fusarium subglutinans]|uniref:SET domain protein n=1 Tax=Gibberella subglutinans TaxID=42677 RepID=A0A8H5UK22_GIBSU|nr:SET domain protein [Fusarium subglutinans]KAF5592021.1 SET domain protein [Fusarium subglutinans]